MFELSGKKLLVLGGRTIGSYQIVEDAKKKGIYTIVTDNLPAEESIAKTIADEIWDISTADEDALVQKIISEHVDGVTAGVSEFNILKAISICEKTGLPSYCDTVQWETLQNKAYFKNLCRENNIPVTQEYQVVSTSDIALLDDRIFPVIVKPVDGSSSRGFSICCDKEELEAAYHKAIEFSPSGKVLVERYMNYRDSVIINYTIVNGVAYYSGMSDKLSRKVFENGAPVMAVQFYPSKDEVAYLKKLNHSVEKMFTNLGLKAGAVWIEAFNSNGDFTFNEVGYRFGGSLTYLPVSYLYGIDQLSLQTEYALCGRNDDVSNFVQKNHQAEYCIFPVHVKPGKIHQIKGLDIIQNHEKVIEIVPVHYLGDKIDAWGSAQQVYAYIHFVTENRDDAEAFAKWIVSTLQILDEDGTDLLFNLFV